MIELVRKGKRLYGALVQTSTSTIYVAFRRPKDLFKDTRAKFVTLSEAVRNEKACWAIDESTLAMARKRGCAYIGVWVKKLNWLFLTPIDSYLDSSKFFRRNYESKGGALQRYVPLRHFATKSRQLRI